MTKKLTALLLALLLGLSPLALAEPESFPDSGIGLGLKFYRTKEEVVAAIPGFSPTEMGIEGTIATGTCELLGYPAQLAVGVAADDPQTLNVIASFEVTGEQAAQVYQAARASIASAWGPEGAPEITPYTGDAPEGTTVADIAAGLVDAAYELNWARERYDCSLGLFKRSENEFVIFAFCMDKQAFPAEPREFREGTAFFRGARWGMTMDDVAQLEGAMEFRVNGAYLIASAPVRLEEGFDATPMYMFVDGLAAAAAFMEPAQTLEQALSDFHALEQALTAKYGQPRAADVIFDEERYGTRQEAEQAEAVSYMTGYAAGDTDIELALHWRAEDKSFSLQYFDASQMPEN